jgi:hypothetical protein
MSTDMTMEELSQAHKPRTKDQKRQEIKMLKRGRPLSVNWDPVAASIRWQYTMRTYAERAFYQDPMRPRR